MTTPVSFSYDLETTCLLLTRFSDQHYLELRSWALRLSLLHPHSHIQCNDLQSTAKRQPSQSCLAIVSALRQALITTLPSSWYQLWSPQCHSYTSETLQPRLWGSQTPYSSQQCRWLAFLFFLQGWLLLIALPQSWIATLLDIWDFMHPLLP